MPFVNVLSISVVTSSEDPTVQENLLKIAIEFEVARIKGVLSQEIKL